MVRPLLFIQGGGEGVHEQWDNKLVASLHKALGEGYAISYPQMPQEAEPNYRQWGKTIASELDTLGDGVLVVGHSIGATILINALAEHPPAQRLDGIFLVSAPFVGKGGWPSDEIVERPLGQHLPKGVPVYLYHGGADDTAPLQHARLYGKSIPQAVIRELDGRDHQLNDDLREVAADILAL